MSDMTHIAPVGKAEAMKICGARGFTSLKHWARENRKGAAFQRKRKKIGLAEALDVEYERYLRPNL